MLQVGMLHAMALERAYRLKISGTSNGAVLVQAESNYHWREYPDLSILFPSFPKTPNVSDPFKDLEIRL